MDACLAVLLAASTFTDLARGRIYNAITYPAIVIGLLSAVVRGGPELVSSALGALIGGATLYVMFAIGSMGGGDVKLMAAIGALKGVAFVLSALFYSIFAGGVFAALALIWRGEIGSVCADLGMVLRRTAGWSTPGDQQLQPKGGSMPFGVAIAFGTLVALASTSTS
ncbi:MAG: A24 family peptidase [Vicinamibacterales bacterium]